MSRLTIGRAGFDVPIVNAASFRHQGDRLTISGRLLSRRPSSDQAVTDAKVLRAQLLGYSNNGDEPIIPVTYDQDPDLDGFYRVLGVSGDVEPGGLRKIGAFPYTVELERVPQYAAPMIEAVILGAARVGSSVGADAEITWHAVPDEADFYSDGLIGVNEGVRTAADGDAVRFRYLVASATPNFHNNRPRFMLAPAAWYRAAATISVGSPLRTVVGDRMVNDIVNWEISNGLVRVRPSGDSLAVSWFNGSSWSTAKLWRPSLWSTLISSYPTTYTLRAVTVLRNGPEDCSIRLSFYESGGGSHYDAYVDLRVRRGDRFVQGYVATVATLEGAWPAIIRTSGAEAATSITDGLRATSNDADSNRFVFAVPTGTVDTTNNGFRSIVNAAFGIGSEIGGTGAVSGVDDATTLIKQYDSADTERLTVVGR